MSDMKKGFFFGIFLYLIFRLVKAIEGVASNVSVRFHTVHA